MTAEQLFLEIGRIDGTLVMSALAYRPIRSRRRLWKYLLAALLTATLLAGTAVSAEIAYYNQAVEYLSARSFDLSSLSRGEIKRLYREEKAKDPYTQREELKSTMEALQGEATFTFERINATRCRLTGIKGTVPEDLVIPAFDPDGIAVWEIGEEAFRGKTELKRVSISTGVRVVAPYAFSGCTSLEVVQFRGDSVRSVGSHAFVNCTALKEIFLGDQLMAVGEWAFLGTSLETLILPESLSKVNENSFSGCEGLQSVCYQGSEGTWLERRLNIALRGLNVTVVFDYGKNLTEGLTFIQQSDGTAWVQGIPGRWQTVIEIPSVSPEGWTITGIDVRAFAGNEFLEEVRIPDTVVRICEGAFENCKALKRVTVPDSVRLLMSSAFWGCTALEEVTLSKNLERIEGALFQNCTSLKSIEIPDGVLSIGARAFEGCDGLREVKLPESLRAIEAQAFMFCKSLIWTDDSLPRGITFIGEYAIDPSYQLPSVRIEEMGVGRHPLITDAEGKEMTFTHEMYIGSYLISVASTEPYTVREGTTLIAQGAVNDLYGIGSVTLPESIRILCSEWIRFPRSPYRTYYKGSESTWLNVIRTESGGIESDAGAQPPKPPTQS